jgi:hypothetical protein
VIYPESARRIIRDTHNEQADTLFAGSEGIYGFQNAQLLPRCIAASSRHKSDTLKATTSDLSGAGTPNHYRGIPRAGEYICRERGYVWLSKRPIIARFESHKYPHFRQKRVSA